MSPKVISFPPIGGIGNSLTTANFQISTVLNSNYKLEFDSPLDLIHALQVIG